MARHRKLPPVDHSPVKDLTITDYAKALELVMNGKTQTEVCRHCSISGPQYWHMLRFGFPKRSTHGEQPSFEAAVIAQSVALRSAGQEAAVSVGIRGVQVLSRQVENANVAQEIGGLLLRCQQEMLLQWLAMPLPRPPLGEFVLSDEGRKLLNTVHRWADLGRPAAAFDRLYDMNVTEQWAHKPDELPAIDTDARELLPAAVSSRDEVAGGDSGKTFQLVEAAKTFDGWTQEEIDRFAETGEEPSGKD